MSQFISLLLLKPRGCKSLFNIKYENISFLLCLILLVSCNPGDFGTAYESKNATSFSINFENDKVLNDLLSEGLLNEGNCELAASEIAGEGCLRLTTSKEFSDGFIHLEKLFGHTIDFTKSRYLYMRLYVPEESWICAMKINYQDANGNNGGCNELFNNFYGNYNQWLNFVIDIQEIKNDFKNWEGTGNSMKNCRSVSFNPYCGHQGKQSSIYISKMQLSDEKLLLDYHPSFAPKIDISPNIPFEIDFDDEEYLRNIMAYRGFESTYQAIEKNIGGNPTTAIRIKANATNKHFVFLPEMDKITGHPVDFTKVDSLYFDYYIPEESDDFSHLILFLTNNGWSEIYLDTCITDFFVKGKWQNLSFAIKDLKFDKIKGDKDIMHEIEQIRVDVTPVDEKRDFEVWIDNFGWK